MNIRRSVIGEIAIREGIAFSGVDVGSLLRRLILFDRVVIKSFRFREIPTLVRVFGKSGFANLLDAGILKLACQFTTLSGGLRRDGTRRDSLGHFNFGLVELAHPDAALNAELRVLQGIPGLNNDDRKLVEQAIWNSYLRAPATYGKELLAQVETDLRGNTPVLKTAVVEELSRRNLLPVTSSSEVVLEVSEPDPRIFCIKSNLSEAYGLSPQLSHDLLQAASFAVGNVNHRIGEMSIYSAIAGFSEKEAPLLFGKLAGVVAPLNPNLEESQFKRVVEIAEVPDVTPASRINVDALLKVRDSAECREFRDRLVTLECASDAEVKEMFASMKTKVAMFATGKVGRVVRFAVTTAVGLVPGAAVVAGPVLGAIDAFLVERVLPRPGIVAFLAEEYPSVFVSG